MAETADTSWSGHPVNCSDCGSPCKYVKDADHDDGTCEVFECWTCGKRQHVELPD